MKIAAFIDKDAPFPALRDQDYCIANSEAGHAVLAMRECADRNMYANRIADHLGTEEEIIRLFHGNSGPNELAAQESASRCGQGFRWGEARSYSKTGGDSEKPLYMLRDIFGGSLVLEDLVSYLRGLELETHGVRLLYLLCVGFMTDDLDTLEEAAEEGQEIATELDRLLNVGLANICYEYWNAADDSTRTAKFEEVRSHIMSQIEPN